MSTRAMITFKENGREMVKLYHHWDGYIEGLGKSMAEWLLSKRLINGIGSDTDESCANGVGCLVAQFIRDFKTEIGNLYVVPIDNDQTEDYNYVIDIKDEITYKSKPITAEITVTRFDETEPYFKGSPNELIMFKEVEEDDDNSLPFN